MKSTFENDTNALKTSAEKKADGFAQDFSKNVKEYSSTAVESISDGYETAIDWVKKNPLQAAAIGAGIGFLLGVAIRRMSERK